MKKRITKKKMLIIQTEFAQDRQINSMLNGRIDKASQTIGQRATYRQVNN